MTDLDAGRGRKGRGEKEYEEEEEEENRAERLLWGNFFCSWGVFFELFLFLFLFTWQNPRKRLIFTLLFEAWDGLDIKAVEEHGGGLNGTDGTAAEEDEEDEDEEDDDEEEEEEEEEEDDEDLNLVPVAVLPRLP